MAQNSAWFSAIFATASKAVEENVKNREYIVLYKSVMDCVRGGENDQGYVRNQLGYNSDNMPTTLKKDEKQFFVRSELFGVIWNKVMADVRMKVADATANQIWGFSFMGMRGVNGYIAPYTSAIERESDSVVFVASKNDAKVLSQRMAPTKVSKTGQKTFTMPILEFVKILDQKLPNHKIAEKHDLFVAAYRAKLGKYADFRHQRLSIGVADLADGYEW